jgi:hypothetical protein
MIRRVTVALGLAAAIGLAGGSAASAHPTGPCDDSGGPGHSDYARHHIVEATPGHVPGSHGGFSLCLGTGRVFHKPAG